jgi:Rrf2 family protein
MFSRSAGYAVQALTYLAEQPPGKLAGAREIATATRIPMPFLWKILRNLSRKKLVRSFKGVRGGYELARSAERIRVEQILSAMQNNGGYMPCIFGFGPCDEHHPCALHDSWTEIRNDLEALLHRTTLADLAERGKPHRRRKSS